ncbi:dihydroxyacetone kinase subunit L [Isoptericola sp. b441]|uniref:Dihydroxyacetone kinase subunit L n=1 Tax=Actinotalea lenta TaxID=3064654 RepID=A0ABT9DCV2_9CELL|nr:MULTISPECIES: dihydroxyacetone kinase subunit L [unclassified Isoptericola]MDO8108351.1 dihydroxyacetone kinase subunit L [Isoptericola sp. b441]MDO8119750.1 dihydroxyacetone kinase subunit L [Isoptericola sp. b490]
MQGTNLNEHIRGSLEILVESADELRDLDQALGDGDLGITITAGSHAVVAELEKLSPTATPTEIARTCAKAFASANPSTMAALVAGALLNGSRTWEGKDEIGLAEATEFVTAAASSISQRGKSEVGDKTILDGIAAVAEALRTSSDSTEATDAAVRAAGRAVEETAGLQSRRGRASWLQERSIGLPDPGATAFQRLVEAWSRVSAATH